MHHLMKEQKLWWVQKKAFQNLPSSSVLLTMKTGKSTFVRLELDFAAVILTFYILWLLLVQAVLKGSDAAANCAELSNKDCDETHTLLRVKDPLAALYPFVGIVAEVNISIVLYLFKLLSLSRWYYCVLSSSSVRRARVIPKKIMMSKNFNVIAFSTSST